MTQRTALDTLLRAAKAWHSALPDATRFCPWPENPSWQPRQPHTLPASDLLCRAPGTPNAKSTALLEALQSAAPFVDWRQSYTVEEVGRHFLDHYGWFELAGPEGHFVTHEARITVGYWGPGLFYPRHQHKPAELYTIVSGRATFQSDGAPDALLGPGQTRYHAPNQPHAMTTHEDPVLTVVFWRGDELAERPRLTQ